MTYYWKINGMIAKKIGGDPPSTEYAAVDPKGIVRHIKNDEIIEERTIEFPEISQEDRKQFDPASLQEIKEIYKNGAGYKIAKDMLLPKYRRKITMKPKSIRKIKVDKKCICSRR
jgi:hypothetical protein